MGSSRSSAGVSGAPCEPARQHTVSRVVSGKRRSRGRVPHARRHPGEDLDRTGTVHGVFLDRDAGHSPFGQSEGGGFVAEAHFDQREIFKERIIFRLFFEERFQFAARLSPSFLGGGMITGDFLRPA